MVDLDKAKVEYEDIAGGLDSKWLLSLYDKYQEASKGLGFWE